MPDGVFAHDERGHSPSNPNRSRPLFCAGGRPYLVLVRRAAHESDFLPQPIFDAEPPGEASPSGTVLVPLAAGPLISIAPEIRLPPT